MYVHMCDMSYVNNAALAAADFDHFNMTFAYHYNFLNHSFVKHMRISFIRHISFPARLLAHALNQSVWYIDVSKGT